MAVLAYNQLPSNLGVVVKGIIKPSIISTKPIVYRSTATVVPPTSYTVGFGS